MLLLAGGMTPSPHVRSALPPAAMCIAADSGLDHARVLGIVPDVAVGDFDSVTADGLDWARSVGVELQGHPASKDQTDLELALEVAMVAGADRLVAAAVGGGRFDHLLANMAVLADRRYDSMAVDALLGTARVAVIHGHGHGDHGADAGVAERVLDGRPDELVSLLPMHGDATGVTTTGLTYPLHDDHLVAGTSWGVSNTFVESEATVSLSGGTLLAVQPDRLAPTAADGGEAPDSGGR